MSKNVSPKKQKRKIAIPDRIIILIAVLLLCVYVPLSFVPVDSTGAGTGAGSDTAQTATRARPRTVKQSQASKKKAEWTGSAASASKGSKKGKQPERNVPELGNLVAHFIDVGQGDSELIELPDGKTMLIDAGEQSAAQTVVSYIKGLGKTRIDYLVATHPHADHIGGLPAVISAFDIGEVWAPNATTTTETFNDFISAVQAKGLKINTAVAGKDIVSASAGYEAKILYPTEGVSSDDMNDYSAIVKLTYGDTSMLFTGDASSSEITGASPGAVDIYKAGHHGSETSTNSAVVSVLKPTYAILSYGAGNSYGHPDQSVLDALAAGGVQVFGTAVNGTITATSDGKVVTVSPSRDGTVTAGVSASEGARQEQEAANAAAAAQAQQQQQNADVNSQETVYVTPNGKKYHRQGCRTLSRSKTILSETKQQAIANGLEACKVCNP